MPRAAVAVHSISSPRCQQYLPATMDLDYPVPKERCDRTPRIPHKDTAQATDSALTVRARARGAATTLTLLPLVDLFPDLANGTAAAELSFHLISQSDSICVGALPFLYLCLF